MTDSVLCLNVILKKSMREDDVEYLVKAIKCFAGVADVQLGPPVTGYEMVTMRLARLQMATKIRDMILSGELDKNE